MNDQETLDSIKPETLKFLLLHGFDRFVINASDFFRLSEANHVIIEFEDLPRVIPVIEKYGVDGLHAVISCIENQLPLQKYRTENFIKASNELIGFNPEVISE